ncbi:MAG: DUF2807 domain-containing protein [Reichenbachiella sp.]
MKRKIAMFIVSIFFTSTIGYGQSEVERSLGKFTGLKVTQNIDAVLLKGETNKLVLTISGIKPDKVLSDISEGTLVLGFKNDKKLEGVAVSAKIYQSGEMGLIESNSSASLVVKDLDYANSVVVRSTGSSTMQLEAVTSKLKVSVSASSKLVMKAKSESAKISISSSGKAQLDINTKTTDATVASKGRLDIVGSTDSQKINVSSSGKYMGYGLKSKTLTGQASNSGRAEVSVSESILVNVVSGGKVFYKGDPKVKVNSTSSGKVEKVE